mmetsp:Transcript_26732/g.59800  ORF Transcript_26732/g.59800 Transcript_26732/m.59800 type:complete len:244 (-) Transcript_26732:353-1084(-)
MRSTFSFLLLFIGSCSSLAPEKPRVVSRRHLLGGGALFTPMAARAFENALPEAAKFTDRPKRKGPQPPDLGLAVRSVNQYGDESDGPVLKICKGAPNCFSTSGDEEFDAASLIVPWKPPSGVTLAAAAKQLEEVVAAYQPGQEGIDGGGFKIITAPSVKPDGTYLYAQFEALKNGYIDDLEFAATKPGEVQVRSSSRVGFLDMGVNAKRLNYISAKLRAKGWDAPVIDKKSHADYFIQNYGPA